MDDVDALTMRSVAQGAGVGQGTLYRHFPTREVLVLAVYHADVERLIAAAAELSARHPPREALRRRLGELSAYGRIKRGVSRIVLAAVTRQAIAERWRPLVLGAVQSLTPGRAPGICVVISTLRTCGRYWASCGRSRCLQDAPSA